MTQPTVLDNYVCTMGLKLTALVWAATAVGGILVASAIDAVINRYRWQDVDK